MTIQWGEEVDPKALKRSIFRKEPIILAVVADLLALNPWRIMAGAMSSKKFIKGTVLGRYQGQYHDPYQGLFHNHLPDPDHRLLPCQGIVLIGVPKETNM